MFKQAVYQHNIKYHLISVSLLLFFFMFMTEPLNAATNEVMTLSIAEDTDVDITIFPAQGDTVLLWLACNEGREGAETRAAAKLVKQGIEIWFPDFLSAHFLPQGPSSIYKITGEEVAKIIHAMVKKHPDKKIYLVAGGRANAPLLKGALTWQKQAAAQPLSGALLLFPRLNLLEPVPGSEPQYIKAVGQAKLPIVILEGERTPNRWGLPHLTNKFRLSGATVSYELLPKVRGYFYTRAKKTKAEKALAEKLPEIIMTNLKKFER